MKILHLLHGKSLGGMEKICIELCNALSQEHTVYLMADGSFEKRVNAKVHFICIDIEAKKSNPKTLWSFYKQIKAIAPDIIHTHKQKSTYIIKRLSWFLKIPFVATKHDVMKKRVYSKISNVISISQETSQTFKAPHVYTIYLGLEKKEIGFVNKENIFTITAIGGLRAVKGFDRLIKACANLSFPFYLQIVGEGAERDSLEQLIISLKLQHCVKLLGFREDVPELLSRSHLQVISSHLEGFSLAMIEGIFYTDMLISTKVSGCVEVLPENLLVEPEDISSKIIDIYDNYQNYVKQFLDVKQKWGSMLEMNHCKEEHVRIYQDIIQQHNV